MIALHISMIV